MTNCFLYITLNRATIFNGQRQEMIFPEDHPNSTLRGEPKGMRQVLIERGLWRQGLSGKCSKGCQGRTDCCALAILQNQPDFLEQKSRLEEIIIARGHKVIFYPKFHCELNYIENFWGAAKRYTRANCNYTWEGLLKTVPEALASVSLAEIRRYARKAFRWMDIYRKGLTGATAEYAVKKYRSHRRVPDNVCL